MIRIFYIVPALIMFGASAATVPQKSQTDYYFSIPNATNSVTRTNLIGQVIGQPPAYRTLRREDIAWLRESACERAALANGSWWTTNSPGVTLRPVFGHFPLSHTNRFASYTIAREWRGGHLETNIVVGWNAITNAYRQAPGKDVAKPNSYSGVNVFDGLTFGSGETRYLAATNGLIQGSRFFKDAWPPNHTNIVTTVVTNWGGWSWDEGGNLVNHVSNHVELVTMPLTNGTVSVHTNSWSESLPWETTSVATNVTWWSYLDLLFEGGEARFDAAPAPAKMTPFAQYSYITNCYAFLARKKWLVDAVAQTNMIARDVYVYDPYVDVLRTNYVLQSDSIGVRCQPGGYYTFSMSGSGRLVFPTRFDWAVVHTGDVCRIKSATLYALVDVSAQWEAGGSYTNVSGCCMRYVGTASKVATPQGGKVCFEATVNGSTIALDGAAAIGAPSYTTWAEWGFDEAAYYVSFYLVYELEPWASLPGW